MNGLYTIGIDRRFADELARGLLVRYGLDPLSLADLLILVPTRRSVRALREAFLRASDGRPTILPRMAPLGDIDEGEWGDLLDDAGTFALPPAIDPAEREALLAELVSAYKDAEGLPVAQSAAQALTLARELASLLDELAIDGVQFDKLESLVQGNFAGHWRHTTRFLAIVGEAWPKILAERGQIETLQRRTQSIRAQAERWRRQPPAHPIIAAGSTGSQPATRELLGVIAGLPNGAVVLPGLDRDMDDESWRQLDPSHPQFGLRELLAALGCERREVAEWPGARGDGARLELISELMRPAATSDAWKRPHAAALDHVTRADCATPHQEAVVIALALRHSLTMDGTAALVTPDRDLAHRVAAELRRWDIEIDDSAGRPLADTPPATLLRALVTAVDSGFAPVDLLTVLKHPLCTLGMGRATLLDVARRLDRKVLRGLKPAPGLATLKALAKEEEARALLDGFDDATSSLAALMSGSATPQALLDETIAAGERLASAETLWSGDAGEALADALARLRPAWQGRRPIAPGEWPGLFTAMLAPETLRPAYGRHPRLAIWGPLEARLQRADLLILGGLNEGTWPPAVDTGPWVNRPMRAALGLPQPERRIGQSAHDFASALAAERVLLTRAEREGGSPTVPSRWLARLDALFGYDAHARTPPEYIQRGRHEYLAWAEKLDAAEYRPWPRPEPRPPIEARPKKLPVSSIEQWRRDPYGLYARRILDLRRLDPLEAELGAADRGSALHAALDEFLKAYPSGRLPPDAFARFEALGRKHLDALLTAPAERAFWWPRFLRLARWFVDTEDARRAAGTRMLASETDGAMTVGTLRIEARADRIDEIEPGGWNIIDYKTGRVPSPKEMKGLFAPQLLLEAAMAEHGGFDRIDGKARAVHLSYWQANGLGDGGSVKDIKDSDELVPQMMALVERMVTHFGNPATAYDAVPWPEFSPYFNDYEHLERIAEWSTAGEGDE
jgi:ATP-dependent helicase/nuclease subunit B